MKSIESRLKIVTIKCKYFFHSSSKTTFWPLYLHIGHERNKPFKILENSVARKFEEKVAEFQKIPKDLHQSSFENPKHPNQSSFKRQISASEHKRDHINTGFKLV